MGAVSDSRLEQLAVAWRPGSLDSSLPIGRNMHKSAPIEFDRQQDLLFHEHADLLCQSVLWAVLVQNVFRCFGFTTTASRPNFRSTSAEYHYNIRIAVTSFSKSSTIFFVATNPSGEDAFVEQVPLFYMNLSPPSLVRSCRCA